ncbi:STAS/SEC14 domain-containing protein [Microbulbifer sp. 2201CG32-9]|uniref:STAS/SEC14 domain-containing protein n=1 Tax=unclassified Microbulbifer TaxID=2619833 RepID=UPI00345B844C
MDVKRHGLSVGIEGRGEHFFLSLSARGKLTHGDYEIMVPMVESALVGVKHPQINVLVDATELEGWEARAAWDDLKFGLKHGRQFKRIAVVGHERWQEVATKAASWFIGGEARLFEDREQAMAWLAEDS